MTGDRYAGETFRADFDRHGVRYDLASEPKSKLYEMVQPWVNGNRVRLSELPELVQDNHERGRGAQ